MPLIATCCFSADPPDDHGAVLSSPWSGTVIPLVMVILKDTSTMTEVKEVEETNGWSLLSVDDDGGGNEEDPTSPI